MNRTERRFVAAVAGLILAPAEMNVWEGFSHSHLR